MSATASVLISETPFALGCPTLPTTQVPTKYGGDYTTIVFHPTNHQEWDLTLNDICCAHMCATSKSLNALKSQTGK